MEPLALNALDATLTWLNDPTSVESDGTDNLGFAAGPKSDWFFDPASSTKMKNAPIALFSPPDAQCTLSAKVTVSFGATFDAGVLFVYADEMHWAKLCFEYAPTNDPMIVSVVTRERSDDCNSVIVEGNTVYLRLYRRDDVLAFHYSLDGQYWHMVRHFTIGSLQDIKLGFCAQSPTGEGCRVLFEEIDYRKVSLKDIRSGE